VLEIARTAKAETATKKAGKQLRTRKIEEAFLEDKIEVSRDDSSNSEASCIVDMACKR